METLELQIKRCLGKEVGGLEPAPYKVQLSDLARLRKQLNASDLPATTKVALTQRLDKAIKDTASMIQAVEARALAEIGFGLPAAEATRTPSYTRFQASTPAAPVYRPPAEDRSRGFGR